MIGQWVSTLRVRYPKIALRGRATFSAVAGMLADGVKALIGAAGFSPASTMTASSARKRSASAALALNAAMAADSIVHGIQYWSVVLWGMGGYGEYATPVLSSASAHSKMFVGGVQAGDAELGSLVPLAATVESTRGETMANGFADDAFDRYGAAFVMSASDMSSNRISANTVGSASYNRVVSHVTAARSIIGSTNHLGALGVAWIGGSDDQLWGYSTYASALAALRTGFDTDIKAATGQSSDVLLFVHQQCVREPLSNGVGAGVEASTAIQTLDAHRANPSKIILIGPDYQFLRAVDSGANLENFSPHGQRALGAMVSRVAAKIKSAGSWTPLIPTGVSRVGAVIDITFNVPTAPLVLDAERVKDPSGQIAGNVMGFSFFDDSASAVVSSVALLSSTVVRVTLDTTPTGANKKIRYAFGSGGGPTRIGPLSANRGCLRDSNDEPNSYGYDSFNWCCVFNESVT